MESYSSLGYGLTLFLLLNITVDIATVSLRLSTMRSFFLTLLLFNFLYISLFNRTCFTAGACVVPSCFQSFGAIVALLQAHNGCYNLKS